MAHFSEKHSLIKLGRYSQIKKKKAWLVSGIVLGFFTFCIGSKLLYFGMTQVLDGRRILIQPKWLVLGILI
jgi:hypothetical protein